MSKFKSGDKIKIKDSVSSKGYYGEYAGMYGVVVGNNNGYWGSAVKSIKLDSGEILYDVGYTVLEKVEDDTGTQLDKMLASLKEILKKAESLKSKIYFMEETGAETFDKTQYQVYQTLKMMKEKDLSDLEKAKMISDMIKS